MQFEFSANPLGKISTDAVLVFAFQTGKQPKLLSSFKRLNAKLQADITKAIETAKFTAKRGETLDFYLQGDFLAKLVIVLGLGKKEEFIADDLRRATGSLAGKIKNKVSSTALQIPSEDEITLSQKESTQLIAEGLILGSYSFSKYKTKEKDEKDLATVIISGSNSRSAKEGIEKAEVYAEATILARDLVNEQAAIATPTYLANVAQDIAKKDAKHIACKVFDKKEAEKLGMNAFLGIARAADTAPKFIVLEYVPDKVSSKEKLALVGKGITFDSGGINVKTGDGMQDMKCDMSGAAIVLSVFSVISKIKPNFSVLGIVAATPNLISGKSLVPGDVVKAMNGKTIEILDTDAEGRVTMADSLSYAVKEKATKILDFATLTGACLVALGTDVTGLFSNNHDLAQDIKKAASAAGEKMWELPLEKDYKELNKSEVADIANIPNTRYGGAITAALFLEEFVDNIPWAHMDIAGPAFIAKSNDLGPKGGTGHGVRTVLNLLL
ncbi:MAG: leucyl aminopeptidase [Candidatus Levyibacteriota bacterium]|jgi:leucyl aminopeptidase